MSNELTQVKNAIALQENELAKALPAHIPSKKFIRVLQTAVSTNQNLVNADRASLFASAQRAAAMGLLPDGREGAIVEFGGKATFMPMLAGIQKLCRQSGQISTMDALCVHKNDGFQYRPGLDEVPVHTPDWFGDRGDLIGVYAVARLKDGAAMVEIMSLKDVEKIRAASRSKGNGPWRDWYEQMALKSVFRRLAKRLPSSTDIDLDAVFADEDEPVSAPATAAEPAPAPAQKKSRLAAAVADAPADVSDATVIDSAGQGQHESPV